MKILLSSHGFFPSVGGIEDVSLMLAQEFVRAGHEVRVVTQTVETDATRFPFAVLRRPSRWALCAAVRWCDVFFQNNISLKLAWPLLLVRRPWVVAHHTWISRVDGRQGWQDQLKRWLLSWAVNVGGGAAVARSLDRPMVVIDNPYPDHIFKLDPAARRDRALIFVGRLVSDKGLDILLEALAQLKARGQRPSLMVVGGGPEEKKLREQTAALGLEAQVEFVGFKTPEALAALMNRHRVLVAPSRRAEPFGLVAIEGIACGCIVIGSEQGGLKDAIGPCGVTFPNGDGAALAAALERVLGGDAKVFQREASAHLEKHRPGTVARAYLDVLTSAGRGRRGAKAQ